jgi:hypothetical protein
MSSEKTKKSILKLVIIPVEVKFLADCKNNSLGDKLKICSNESLTNVEYEKNMK